LQMRQPKPAQIEVYRGAENVSRLASGYQSVKKEGDVVAATAKVAGEGAAAFAVEDQWKVSGATLSLSRKVNVTTAEDNAGFFSAIRLATAPTVKWEDVNCLIPGMLYDDPSHAGGGSPAGAAGFRAKRFTIREDYLSAPMIGMAMQDGNWAAVLDMAPKGDTTQAESNGGGTIVDERIMIGAVGAREISGGGIELGFWLPCTTAETGGGRGGGGGGGRRGVTAGAAAEGGRGVAPGIAAGSEPAVAAGGAPPASVRGRYHPVKAGLTQNYQVGFRFDRGASFLDVERDAWRWAWDSLKPRTKLMPIDVEVARATLLDHLSAHVLTVEDRSGIPFTIDTITGRGGGSMYEKIIMGFCGKNLEGADELLQEGDRDKTARGEKMRQQGLAIIDSLIRLVPMSPPAGVGFSIQTGQPVPANYVPGFTLRMPAEDLAVLVNTYRREKMLGRDHPEWIKWVASYCDWLLTQQGEDGSFPAAWQGGTGQVIRDGKTTSYVPVPVLVRLSEVTRQKKYLDSATKAADYIWTTCGSKGVYLGATGTGNNIADKESGMLSLEAFLAVYDNTQDPKWLQRAQAAANYAETWIWIWNVPMPMDADDATLHWKKGVPTIGANGIGSDVVGGVDQYLDWAVPSYAKLYKLTLDEHYLDVAYVLLHGTKAMLALPGRTYDMAGPGWQQEHWTLGPGRKGMGAHRNWLPWVSMNHLNGIMGLQALDESLYQRLAKGN
ncbi:MAG TPA: hypothetical protein VN765_07215, partial [Candidatus Acidoferrum sp.]|nr:hypothetical protein [Candidatus Acidoferrum sp.]